MRRSTTPSMLLLVLIAGPTIDDAHAQDLSNETRLTLAGLPGGTYTVHVDGRTVATVKGTSAEQKVVLPVGTSPAAQVTIARIDGYIEAERW